MNITVVGLGVIGGSFTMALKRAGYAHVTGVDIDPATIETALAEQLITSGSTHGEELLPDADLTILALYPNAVIPWLIAHRQYFKPHSIITDVSGVKTGLVEAIRGLNLPEGVDFIPGHPMAGREKRGFAFASDTVFQNANYLLTPMPENREENIRLIEELVQKLGFRSIRRITPEFHDEMIAFTSQLPHALAVALINSDREGRETSRFIGDSYRELTRIAYINEQLWSELFLENRDNLLAVMEDFERELSSIRSALKQQDAQTLIEMFQKSSARREKLT